MPAKLIVLIALMGLNVVANLAQEKYLAGVLGVLILLGVVAGNEAVRKLVIGLNILSLIVAVVVGGLLLVAGGVLLAPVVLVTTTVSIVASAFGIWCLSQRDVQHWMYKRSMKGAAD